MSFREKNIFLLRELYKNTFCGKYAEFLSVSENITYSSHFALEGQE
jgi:hypothetical protein